MKKVLTVLSLSLLSAFAMSQSAYIPPEKPRLVIGIVVEQLRFDQLERIWNTLPDDGLKRLVSEGTYYRNV